MPPFISTTCPNCKHPSRFDLAEIRRKDGSGFKQAAMVFRGAQREDEEFSVTCDNCGQGFKFSVPSGTGATDDQAN